MFLTFLVFLVTLNTFAACNNHTHLLLLFRMSRDWGACVLVPLWSIIRRRQDVVWRTSRIWWPHEPWNYWLNTYSVNIIFHWTYNITCIPHYYFVIVRHYVKICMPKCDYFNFSLSLTATVIHLDHILYFGWFIPGTKIAANHVLLCLWELCIDCLCVHFLLVY